MSDANLKSTIYLKNNVETSAITATPILYLSNGTKYTLSEVALEAAGTAAISVNQELAKQNVASWATLNGYVEIEYRWPWDALCGMVQNTDPVHSLIFTNFLGPGPSTSADNSGPASHSLEAMWWKQESDVTAFVAMSNLQGEPAHATLQVTDNDSNIIGIHAITISPRGTKLVALNELKSASQTGAITITYSGPEDGVVANGGLQDPATGYSANLRFGRPVFSSAPPKKRTYAALGLMSGAADPMMNFLPDTIFTPYAVLRNVEDHAITVSPLLYWMEGGGARSAALPPLMLPPHHTENLEIPSLLAVAGLQNYNGSINLILETDNQSQGLLIVAGSVDQKNTYVFEVTPRPIAESASKGMSYWNTGDGNDTMVTFWNPADEGQDFLFTLYFAGGHYGFPIHLGPRATHTLNVSEIVHNQIPDSEGNIIPASVHEGSAVVSGMHGENEIILVAVDAGTYNVRKATCGGQCITCQGEVSAAVVDNPFGVAVGGNHQLTMRVTFHNGLQYDYSSQSSWTSNHTNLATVDNGATAGKVAGVSPGLVSISAFASEVPQYAVVCAPQNFPPPECPVTDVGGSDPGTVAKLTCPSSVTRGGSATCTVSGQSGVTASGWKFTDANGDAVTTTSTSLSWSGTMVTSGTVTVNATASGATTSLSGAVTVNNRTNFGFTAVNPSQLTGTNSITCYGGNTVNLPSPPSSGSYEGYSCADLAYSFNTATINDNGPNNGYQYVTSASDSAQGQPTQFQFIVVFDLLSGTTFYNQQCGNYSSSSQSGFIAGSQLKQNVFDHEDGSVLSHWTEYRDAQNNSSNNIGMVLESTIAPPRSTGNPFQTAGNAALSRIAAAASNEPCGGSVNEDSSQSCAYCGTINFKPYQSCSGNPVPHCQ